MSGEDYEYTSREVSLIGNQSIAVVSIPIINDDLAEGAETFGGVLEVTSQSLNLSSVSTIQIEIIDDEGKQCEMVGTTCSTAVCFLMLQVDLCVIYNYYSFVAIRLIAIANSVFNVLCDNINIYGMTMHKNGNWVEASRLYKPPYFSLPTWYSSGYC